jgi:O-antigen/teichoic acid export membrane protein
LDSRDEGRPHHRQSPAWIAKLDFLIPLPGSRRKIDKSSVMQSSQPSASDLGVPPTAIDAPVRVDETGVELKRGMFFNTVAMLASVLRGIFIFLVARLLGPASLGTFSIAWAATDVISKIGIFGLDSAVTTFIARAEAVGDHARSRTLFHLAVALAMVQSLLLLIVSVAAIRLIGNRFGLQPEMISALALVLCALPGIALYRISVAVSRGMKVMQHDIYSRGMTEPFATTLAFLLALAIGFKSSAPALAAIVGSAASGLVALMFAAKLFRSVPAGPGVESLRVEALRLLGYAAPISGYQLLGALLSRLDLIMLGYFVGRAPGVTLARVGIYSAVVDIASALRKINQAFNPIFAPVVAGMTATGAYERAAATYARLSQWMLWMLLPLITVITLAGDAILSIYGPAFRQGNAWLSVVTLTCAISTFISLSGTVIMVQRPRLNLWYSVITCAVAAGILLWLIPRFGVSGAAFGILVPNIIQGLLQYAALRIVFGWKDSWRDLSQPVVATIIALVPALASRALLSGIPGQLTAVALFLAVFGFIWWKHHFRSRKRS